MVGEDKAWSYVVAKRLRSETFIDEFIDEFMYVYHATGALSLTQTTSLASTARALGLQDMEAGGGALRRAQWVYREVDLPCLRFIGK